VIHRRARTRSGPVAAGTAVSAVAVALLLAACGSGAGASDPSGSTSPVSPSTSASPAGTRPAPAPTQPLTGLPAGSAAALTRPIVVVDVGFVGDGSGLRGVGQADLVYQEFDTPGLSRLIAAFQSADATVGPVAATAPVDARATALMGLPVLAFNGGPTGFIKQVGPTVVTPRSTGAFGSLFTRNGSLFYVSTAVLRASAPKAPPAPQGLLSFGGPTAQSATGARPVRHLTVLVPGQAAQSWSFNGTGWVGPGGVTVTNLVVQDVLYKSLTSAKDPTVHSAELVGTGAATVIGNGFAVACTWSRPQPLKITNYFDSRALPVALTPGRTWIILAPAGTKVTAS
jgi:Protein of unknown function (DUF3048) C-terminal domain/Protein of unknown function (DUF3048) N-terminal domain